MLLITISLLVFCRRLGSFGDRRTPWICAACDGKHVLREWCTAWRVPKDALTPDPFSSASWNALEGRIVVGGVEVLGGKVSCVALK